MSYILNALKKAEHDRLREEPQDLDDFVSSGWDPYQKPGQQRSRGAARYWLPLTIVVIAAALYYWFTTLSSAQNFEQMTAEKITAEKMAPPVTETIASMQEVIEPQTLQAQAAAAQDLQSSTSELPTRAIPATNAAAVEIPAVNISGHIFIRSGSRLNRIFVGEKTYHVGDSLDKNWVIESINSDSLTLRSGAMKTQLPLR